MAYRNLCHKNQIKTKMKKIKLFLVLTFLMFITASVASPIDNGGKDTTVQCSKEYNVIDNINNAIKTVESADDEKFSGCVYRRSAIAGDLVIKCILNGNGIYTKEYSLYDGDGGLISRTSTGGLSYCSCN